MAMRPSIAAAIRPSANRLRNRLDRSETPENVADVPLLKVGDWQPKQVMEQACADLEVQSILQDEYDVGADCR